METRSDLDGTREERLRGLLREEAAQGQMSPQQWASAVATATSQPQRKVRFSRWRLALPAMMASVLVGAFALSGLLGSGLPGPGDTDTRGVTPDTTAPGSISTASCVEAYSAETLKNRAFAFDGTIKSVERRTVRNPEGAGWEETWAVFTVNRWYKGGGPVEVGVWMGDMGSISPSGGMQPGSVKVGSRLLVTGEARWGGEPLDEPVAWMLCGFTQPYSPERVTEWAAALG